MKKLTLGYPCYQGLVQDAHIVAYELLRQGLAESGAFALHSFARVDTSSIAHGRNLLLYQAIVCGADWLLMMDADTYYVTERKPHPAVTMLLDAVEQCAAVVAAGVPLRDGSRRLNVVRAQVNHARDSLVYLDKPDDQLAPCVSVGSAYMAVNVQWIKACWPKGPWFEDALSYEDKPVRHSEDMVFCERVASKGGLLLADTRFTPHHVGA